MTDKVVLRDVFDQTHKGERIPESVTFQNDDNGLSVVEPKPTGSK